MSSGWAAAGPFAVGRGLFDGSANWFTGRVGQVRVWSRALSGTDVSRWCSRGVLVQEGR